MLKEYLDITINSSHVLIREECIPDLLQMDAIIFDCDGVLIDVRESYTRAVIEALSYFMKEFFEIDVPSTPELRKVIHLFRRSGGFNSDWDTLYSLLLPIFCKAAKKRFILNSLQHSAQLSLVDRFQNVKKIMRRHMEPEDKKNLFILTDAYDVARIADSTGIASIENIFSSSSDTQVRFKATKQFLSYPGDVGESLPTTVFEEMFCGKQLFEKQYALTPQFYTGEGLIERERRIITPRNLEELSSFMGKPNFGIASGRPYLLGAYTLGETLNRFNRDALIFIDEVIEAERRNTAKGIQKNLKKPNPYSLLKSVEALKPFQRAAYIGDSAEDVLMVKRARRTENRFIAVGVYSASNFQTDLISSFIEMKTDIILPSIEDFIKILYQLRGG